MTRKTNVRVVAFPKTQYDKEWLDTLKDAELRELLNSAATKTAIETIITSGDGINNNHNTGINRITQTLVPVFC